MEGGVIVFLMVFIGIIFLSFFFWIVPVRLWITAIAAGVKVGVNNSINNKINPKIKKVSILNQTDNIY